MRNCKYPGCTIDARILTGYCFKHTSGRRSCVAAFCGNRPGIDGIWCEDHKQRQAWRRRSLFVTSDSNGEEMQADADYAEHWQSRFAKLDSGDFIYPTIKDGGERETG